MQYSNVQRKVKLDASLQGLGENYNNEVYVIPLPKNYGGFGIIHLEMLNIMVAVRVWKYCWARKSILIYCDNQAVVSVLNSDKTHDMLWAALAHNISMNIAMADINIKLIHIMSKKNVLAYSFSKFHIAPQHQDKVSQIFTIAPQRLHQSLRNSTSRAYNLMFRIFIAFSIFANIQLCHLSSNHILAFREFLVFNKECHMTLNYISAIKYKFSIFHLDISPFLDPRIKYILYFNKSLSLSLSKFHSNHH